MPWWAIFLLVVLALCIADTQLTNYFRTKQATDVLKMRKP